MLPILARLALGAALLGGAVGASRAQAVTGAGASFPAPLYAQWAEVYRQATGTRINYQSAGSLAGIRQVVGGRVDFGATDAPLSEAQLAQAGLIQFPVLIGGVVPVVHLAGLQPGQLRLTGALLGDIFLGKIGRWNDAAITALNPGLALPDAPITVVHRADGSGTSFLFTRYLSSVHPEWRARVGAGAVVNWPTGVGGKGNEGMAVMLQRFPNAIGFVDYSSARLSQLSPVQLRNQAGRFVGVAEASVRAAAAGAAWSRSLNQVLIDPPGSDSWPITGVSYVLMHRVQHKPAQAAALLKFFHWAYTQGDAAAQTLGYLPLPAPAESSVRALWAAHLKDPAGHPIALP